MFGKSEWTFYYRSHEQMDKNLFPVHSKIFNFIWMNLFVNLSMSDLWCSFPLLVRTITNKEKHTVLFYTYLKNS